MKVICNGISKKCHISACRHMIPHEKTKLCRELYCEKADHKVKCICAEFITEDDMRLK